MRIENEMLSRFGRNDMQSLENSNILISEELDFFFDNVMETVVDYFTEKELSKL